MADILSRIAAPVLFGTVIAISYLALFALLMIIRSLNPLGRRYPRLSLIAAAVFAAAAVAGFTLLMNYRPLELGASFIALLLRFLPYVSATAILTGTIVYILYLAKIYTRRMFYPAVLISAAIVLTAAVIIRCCSGK